MEVEAPHREAVFLAQGGGRRGVVDARGAVLDDEVGVGGGAEGGEEGGREGGEDEGVEGGGGADGEEAEFWGGGGGGHGLW